MFDVVHEVPGRLRLKVAALKGRPGLAPEISARAKELPGVVSVKANPLTGSLILHHDGEAGRREAILSTLDPQAPAPASGILSRSDKFAAMLADVLVERLMERALHAAITALI